MKLTCNSQPPDTLVNITLKKTNCSVEVQANGITIYTIYDDGTVKELHTDSTLDILPLKSMGFIMQVFISAHSEKSFHVLCRHRRE
jgi:hypothetical protein